jgi:hemoglobin/transferrin/lactoferrin receptor protein
VIPRRAALIFLALVVISLPGLGLDIKGRVLNIEGKPVAKAVILSRADGRRTLSDDQGFFSLSLPAAGRVVLEVIHPDYMEEEVSLTGKSLTRPLTITLTPYIRQREEIVVTAMRYPEPSAQVPAASSVITGRALEEELAPNIAAGIKDLPGVSEVGSGGFSLVPSIRGLARRRVLILVDYARLSSDRRTGPSASFISPEDIARIEVLRSPSSVFYGSDAVGGVVHILTREPDAREGINGTINSKFGTVNREKGLGFSLSARKSNLGCLVSLQGVKAQDYRSPYGRVLQSQFTQSSWLGKVSYQTERREVEGSVLIARGRDIGKPNRDSATKPTWYPRENQNLIQFHWREKEIWAEGKLSLNLYLNPNYLETRSKTIVPFKTKESYGKTQSTDYGVQLALDKRVGGSLRLTGGMDFFGRTEARAVNRDTSFDAEGNMTGTFEETPYTSGKREDMGFFVSVDYDRVRGLDLVAGVRLDFLASRANPGGGAESATNRDRAITGFLACSAELTERIIAFANISRAFRAPDLNELYYTGITGRGFIIANPGLAPESSFGLDCGLKFLAKRLFAAVYAFRYDIKDMIERYPAEPSVYTYANIEKGRIRGMEVEWEYFPWSGLSLFGNLQLISGKSQRTGQPLNDIPPRRLFLGARVWFGRFSLELNGVVQAKMDDPGPAEIPIPGAQYLNLEASYFLAPSLNFYFVLSNLFNAAYLARPDPEAREAPGRNLLFGVRFLF